MSDRIEDRLAAAARDLRAGIDGEVGSDPALAAAMEASTGRPKGPRRGPLLAVAAALVLIALLAAGVGTWWPRDDELIADGATSRPAATTDAEARARVLDQIAVASAGGARSLPTYRSLADLLPNVVVETPWSDPGPNSDLVVVGRVVDVQPGSGYVVAGDDAPSGTPTAFDDPAARWRTVHLRVQVESSLGGVPSQESVVVGLRYPADPDELGLWEQGLVSLGRTVFFLRESAVFADEPGVLGVLEDGALLAPVDETGALSLPMIDASRAAQLLAPTPTLADLVAAGERPRVVLDVDDDGVVTERPGDGPTVTTLQGGPDDVQGSDLGLAEPGFEVTFDRIGSVRLGQVVDASEVDFEFHPCGYWPTGLDASGFDDPGQSPTALVDGSGDQPVLSIVYIRLNPVYRTASGVGVGTTLATLERIYGDDLVVDRSDGWEHPTGGLLASYQDVAAVRNADRALTFYLRGDVVETIKLSSAQFWGDDEGCV